MEAAQKMTPTDWLTRLIAFLEARQHIKCPVDADYFRRTLEEVKEKYQNKQ